MQCLSFYRHLPEYKLKVERFSNVITRLQSMNKEQESRVGRSGELRRKREELETQKDRSNK